MDILQYVRRRVGVVDAKLIDNRGPSVPSSVDPSWEARLATRPNAATQLSRSVAVTNYTVSLVSHLHRTVHWLSLPPALVGTLRP